MYKQNWNNEPIKSILHARNARFHSDQNILRSFFCLFVHALLYKHREENQLDATEWFIVFIICSTHFGHLYAHQQEFETAVEQFPSSRMHIMLSCPWPPTTNNQDITHYTR